MAFSSSDRCKYPQGNGPTRSSTPPTNDATSGCIVTIVRLGYIHNLTSAQDTFLINCQGIGLMSCVELAVGLVCISLATYRPLVNRYITNRTRIEDDDDNDSESQLDKSQTLTAISLQYTNVSASSPTSTEWTKRWTEQSLPPRTPSFEDHTSRKSP